MFIHRRRGWEIAESEVTPEALSHRRALLGGVAGAVAAGAVVRPAAAWSLFDSNAPKAPAAPLKPLSAPRNPHYVGRPRAHARVRRHDLQQFL